jgi:hypothetical protein
MFIRTLMHLAAHARFPPEFFASAALRATRSSRPPAPDRLDDLAAQHFCGVQRRPQERPSLRPKRFVSRAARASRDAPAAVSAQRSFGWAARPGAASAGAPPQLTLVVLSCAAPPTTAALALSVEALRQLLHDVPDHVKTITERQHIDRAGRRDRSSARSSGKL